MSTITRPQDQLAALATKAADIQADSSLTSAEAVQALNAVETDIKSLSDRINAERRVKGLVADLDQVEEATPAWRQPVAAKSIGEEVAASDAFAAVKSGVANREHFAKSIEVGTKATISEINATPGTYDGLGGAALTPNYVPGIMGLRFAPLTVADLFAQGTTDSPIISYLRQSSFTNAAAPVAEKATKPSSDIGFARVTEQLGKIAHIAKVTDEMTLDVGQITAFINATMIQGVQLAEQSALLNGSGLPGVNGLLGRAGLQATYVQTGTKSVPTNGTGADVLYHQITMIRTNSYFEPDAIVINPLDWEYIRLSKDNQGQYYGGGPFTGSHGTGQPNIETLWGMRVVVTPAIAAGTALVGSFGGGSSILYRQGGIRVEWTNTNVNDFENNLLTVRAEERLALAVFYPAAFGKVTLL